jgi:hypothetical protein
MITIATVRPSICKLKKKNFSGVEKFLKDGFCRVPADTLHPSDQATTWVSVWKTPTKRKRQVGVKPALHLAIVADAPPKVVVSLVELHLAGVRCTDDQHMLPLHLAMRYGSPGRYCRILVAAIP